MTSILSGLRRSRRGTAALELGLIAPVLIVLLGGLVDIGLAVHRTLALETAARAGAQHAMSFPDDTAGIAAATVAALGTATAAVSVTQPYCSCPGSSTSVSCEGTPCDGAAAGRYVSVRAIADSETVFGIAGIVLPANFTGAAIARVR
jgi:Flp pilus assembly protein TadG